MRDRRYLLFIPVAALLALLPLALKGSSCGHDFSFHLLNWLEVNAQWRQGFPYPHWDFSAAWNSGAPRFVFYPPLSWVAGALAGFVLPWVAVPNIFIWLALMACGFTMYRTAREWASESTALIAACFYMVHPYMLFTFYERSAFAELLAAAWIPLIVLAILRRRISILGIALPVALLWLTDDPAAVMGCYLLAWLAVARVAWTYLASSDGRKTLFEAGRIALGTCIGLAVAGFYLVPAIAEQRWVRITMAEIPGVRVEDNFLFGQFGGPSHRAILRTASLCSVSLLALIAIFGALALLTRVRKPPEPERGYRRFVILALLAAGGFTGFLLTPPSAALWRYAPKLKYLQFPWRLDALLGAIAAALLALALDRMRMRPIPAIVAALVIAAGLSLGGNSWFRQYCNVGYAASDLVSGFSTGNPHDSTDEYPPVGSNSLTVRHANPPAWIAADPRNAAPKNASVTYSTSLANRLHFNVQSARPAFLVINLRDYPEWRITVNGARSMNRPHRDDGLIAVAIPKGESTISITYALTADRVYGWLLTALGLALFFVSWHAEQNRCREELLILL
ncbi:MAG: hypothetical protein WAM66_01795 [Acidobacteriaceae bacterium]